MTVQDKDATDVTIDKIKSILEYPLDHTLLADASEIGSSEFVNTAKYKGITFIVEAESVTTGADIKFQGSLDGVSGIDLTTFEDNGSTGSVSKTISANGMYVFTVPDSITMKYMAAEITSITDGAYTVTILGKPL